MAKIVGYGVSGSRNPNGKSYLTMKEARDEMDRQMRKGSSTSGIFEIKDKELFEKLRPRKR